jgi:hypothetical protein
MYVTGSNSDVASRLHQLATNQTILNSFITEVSGQWPNLDQGLRIKLEREARLAKFRFTTGDASALTTVIWTSL